MRRKILRVSVVLELYGTRDLTRSQTLHRLKEIGYTEQEGIFVLSILDPEPSRSTPQAMIQDTLPPSSPRKDPPDDL